MIKNEVVKIFLQRHISCVPALCTLNKSLRKSALEFVKHKNASCFHCKKSRFNLCKCWLRSSKFTTLEVSLFGLRLDWWEKVCKPLDNMVEHRTMMLLAYFMCYGLYKDKNSKVFEDNSKILNMLLYCRPGISDKEIIKFMRLEYPYLTKKLSKNFYHWLNLDKFSYVIIKGEQFYFPMV